MKIQNSNPRIQNFQPKPQGPQPPEGPHESFAHRVTDSAVAGTSAFVSGMASCLLGGPGYFLGVAGSAAIHGVAAQLRGNDWKDAAMTGAAIGSMGGLMGLSGVSALVYLGAGAATLGPLVRTS